MRNTAPVREQEGYQIVTASVKFKLSDLPPHLRQQAERQLAASPLPRVKTAPKPPETETADAPRASPIRLPKERTPNRTEARFAADHPLPDGGRWQYEALSFRCPSGRYTPDWVSFSPDGTLTAVEVKGAYRFASQAAAAAKFKECAALYPAVRWLWAKWTGRDWRTSGGLPDGGKGACAADVPHAQAPARANGTE